MDDVGIDLHEKEPRAGLPLLAPLLAVAIAVALTAAPAAAQAEGDPLPTAPVSPSGPSPAAGDRRWTITSSVGVSSTGAPGLLLGFGVGAMVGSVRLDFLASLGRALGTKAAAVNPAWDDGFNTYTAARSQSQTFLLELTGSRRVGALEAWLGLGAHFTQAQLGAEYDALRCTDFLCLGPKIPVHDIDWHDGAFVIGPVVGAGLRLPLFESLLLGLDARALLPGRSRVNSLPFERQVGGLSVTAGLTLRLGDRLRRE